MKHFTVVLALLASATIGIAQTWTSLNSPTGFKNVRDIAVTYRSGNGDTMYAADELKILKSVNAGQAWSATSSVLAGASSVTCKYDNHWTVLAAGPSVFSRSTDGGANWTAISGFVNKPTALVNFPANTSVMLAGKKYYSTDERSIARSTDAGATWIHNDLSTSYKTQMFDIAINVSGAYPMMVVAAGCAVDATVNDKGLWYSEDYGDTWVARMASTGTGWTAVAFRYHSATETQDTVYAGTAGGDFYRGTWKASSMGSPLYTFPDTIRSITIHPDSTWVVFVTTDRSVYKSTNKGSTWSSYVASNLGMVDTRSFVLRYKPGASSTLIVGTRGNIYRSTNYGTAWSSIGSTTTRSIPFTSVTSLSDTVFSGSDELTVGAFYDNSAWDTVRLGGNEDVFLTHHTNTFFNGGTRYVYQSGASDDKSQVYRSTDNGASFTEQTALSTDTPSTVCKGIIADPNTPASVYAFGRLVGDNGLKKSYFISSNYGDSWTRTTNQISGTKVFAFQPVGDANPSNKLYAGIESGGVQYSNNAGSTWSAVSGISGTATVYTLALNKNCDDTLYAGGIGGLWRSTAATSGGSFSNRDASPDVKRIVIDPRFTDGSYKSSYILYVGTDNAVYRSENGGSSSIACTGDLPAGIVINDLRTDPGVSNVLYIASDKGIYKATLPTAPASLTYPANGEDSILACISSTEPLTFTWAAGVGATSYDIQIDESSSFAVPEDSATVGTNSYTKTTNLGNCSRDYYWRVRSNTPGFGASPWSSVSTFRTQECNMPTLDTVDLSSPTNGRTNVVTNPVLYWNAVAGAIKYKVVISGGQGEGTFYSTSTSLQLWDLAYNTWYDWDVTAVNCAINPVSPIWSFKTCLNCQTGPEGGQTATGEVEIEEQVKEYALAQNYPNPFNPTTRFDFAIKEPGHVRFQIFNTLGQVVATLMDEYQAPGYKSVEFDASRIPSGVYFYRLTAGTFNSVKKMIFMK